MRAKYSDNPIFLDLITIMPFDEKFKWWNSSLCTYLLHSWHFLFHISKYSPRNFVLKTPNTIPRNFNVNKLPVPPLKLNLWHSLFNIGKVISPINVFHCILAMGLAPGSHMYWIRKVRKKLVKLCECIRCNKSNQPIQSPSCKTRNTLTRDNILKK
jgi:hypothetical protein